MKNKIILFALVAMATLLGVSTADAATITVTASANWSALTGGTGPGGLPNSSDTVEVRNSATLTVDVTDASCGTLQLGGANTAGAGTLTFSGVSPQIVVSGNVAVGGWGNANRDGTITFTSGATMTAGSLTLGGTGATPAQGVITMTAGGTLSVGGAITVGAGGGTWTPGTGTLELTANNILPAATFTTFNNLIVSAGTTTLGVATTTTVNGDFTVSGSGTLVASTGSTNRTLTVAGDVSISGSGGLTLSSGSAIGTLNVAGNFSDTGGTITETSSGSGAIVFNGSASQTYTSGGTVANTINFTVNSGATLLMGTSLLGDGSSGTFTLTSGGTLGIGDPAGITTSGATGNIRVGGTRTFNATANYIYDGTAAQHTGNGLPTVGTVTSLTISNSAGVTLDANATIGTALTISTGTFDIGSFTVNQSGSGGTLTVANAAKLKIGGTGTTIPSGYGTYSFGVTSTIEYAGAAQTVGVQTYGNLILSGSGLKSMAAGIAVDGNLSIAPAGGGAQANITAGQNLVVNSLTLGGALQVSGTWGSTSSSAVNQNNTYFAATTGILTVGATRLLVTLPNQTFTPGTGNSGTVVSQTAGTPFNITLTAVDANNNIDTSFSGSKTVSYGGPGNAISGGGTPAYTTTVNFTAGQANSVATTLVRAQSTTITATIAGLTGVASSSLTVVAATASQVAFTTQPANTADGVLMAAVVVTVQDSFGNTVTSSTAPVTVAFSSNPAGGILRGTLTVNAASGVATFSDLLIYEVGNSYTLAASSSPLTGATSSSFNITQATGDYRSAASGTWATLATWERWSGSAWLTPTAGQGVPSSSSGTIIIRSPHVVTVSANASGDQMRIGAGGQLSISSNFTFTVANGAGTDLDVYGTVNNAGTVTISSGATAAYQSGGKYQHNWTTTAGTIPTATWDANSTCEIIGYTTGLTLGTSYDQLFGHFVWNCATQGSGACNLSANMSAINGDFTVANTGTSGNLRLTGNTTFTLDIGGNLIVAGGTLVFSSGSGSPIVNVAGDVTLNSGTLQPAISTGLPILNVAGDWSNNGGSFAPGAGTVKFNSTTAAQAINGTATSQTFSNLIVAKSGQTLSVGGSTTTLAVNGHLGIAAGTLDAGTATAINLAGNWTNSGTFTSGGSTVTFGGTSSQILAGATTFNGLTVNNAAGAVFNSAVTVNGTLALNVGKVTGTGSATIAGTGTLKGTTSIYIPVTLSGIVAPGSSPGRLASRSELWNGGATYQWELTNATGTIGSGWDLLSVTNGIDLQATTGTPFNLNLASLNGGSPGAAINFNNNATTSWIITVTTNGTVTNFAANKFTIDNSLLVNDLAGGVFSVNTNNGPTNLNLTFTPNNAPVAYATNHVRNKGSSFKINIASLLSTSTSDADGDARGLVSVSGAAHGTLATNGTFILYTPSDNSNDSFTYTVGDIRTAYRTGDTHRTASGTISITVVTAGGIAMLPVVSGTTNTLNFAGIPGYQYDIQRALDAGGPWTNQGSTVTAPATGLFQYEDSPRPTPSAFYRLILH